MSWQHRCRGKPEIPGEKDFEDAKAGRWGRHEEGSQQRTLLYRNHHIILQDAPESLLELKAWGRHLKILITTKVKQVVY